jgi:hypothetical protein
MQGPVVEENPRVEQQVEQASRVASPNWSMLRRPWELEEERSRLGHDLVAISHGASSKTRQANAVRESGPE